MSKLMWIAGILLAAAGAALGIMVMVSGASMGESGLTLETAAIFLVGGILSLGLGSVINLLDAQRHALTENAGIVAATAPPPASIPEFGRKASEAAPAVAAAAAGVTAAATVAAAKVEEDVSEPTRDTIEALEEARQKIEQAFEPKPAEPEVIVAAAPEPEPEPESAPEVEAEAAAPAVAEEAAAEEEPLPEEEVAEGQLYVVEERYIRMRPARILSDGTVEAETAEGWMRFENLEHLDEYLDAMEPVKS